MRNGFTLVELSIVLVILGLLTGGILAGKSLIRSSELNSVLTEYKRYVAGVQTFRDQYNGLPGDITTATRAWGDQATGTGACADAGIPDGSPGTCNGNGDGTVAGNTSNERFRFWQQLALAGMIEGSYTGIAGSGGSQHHVPGQNCPASKLSNTGWTVDSHVNTYAGDGNNLWSWTVNTAPGHMFKMGYAATNDETYDPAFTQEEIWNMDKKIDDGKPGLGKVWTRYWANCTDAADRDSAATANYKFTSTDKQCAPYFVRAF